ncbi:tripartite tricarboxylate transporter TctB family protein [Mameliella sediminis]|uniref:tripartite tricarboxylate transporter TctB family protein n=1 Tax=Mameliella sediminis TaxID=2836866 RepID=UPI001C4414D2|nr:tripartite tricarboxylate transporter TctB family protein [Mameliella sediminis]MBV7396772.1 tripartite tricarboxylate transporter TctB family protein [Mameliella sediminis]
MGRFQTFQDLFKRYRRPGDLVFASLFCLFAVFLLAMLPYETQWVKRTKLFAQPAFWPAVSVGAMALFGVLHLLGALVSERIPGRGAEVLAWLKSVEYALWFMAYVALVPVIGYLAASILFACVLAFRLGYRSARWQGAAVLFAVAVVVVFKGLLQVKIPAGMVYELLPSGAFRTFMMTYL